MFRRSAPFYLFAVGLLTAPSVPAQTPAEPLPDQGSSNSSGQEHLSSSISQAIREKLPAYAGSVCIFHWLSSRFERSSGSPTPTVPRAT